LGVRLYIARAVANTVERADRFVQACRRGIRPEMPVDDSARTLAADLAAKQSTDGGLPLTIVPLTEER